MSEQKISHIERCHPDMQDVLSKVTYIDRLSSPRQSINTHPDLGAIQGNLPTLK